MKNIMQVAFNNNNMKKNHLLETNINIIINLLLINIKLRHHLLVTLILLLIPIMMIIVELLIHPYLMVMLFNLVNTQSIILLVSLQCLFLNTCHLILNQLIITTILIIIITTSNVITNTHTLFYTYM